MADCKVCGGWFSSTAPSELCPTCERALKRLNGYAVPVVRCKDCTRWKNASKPLYCSEYMGDCVVDDEPVNRWEYDFCSYGERREGE